MSPYSAPERRRRRWLAAFVLLAASSMFANYRVDQLTRQRAYDQCVAGNEGRAVIRQLARDLIDQDGVRDTGDLATLDTVKRSLAPRDCDGLR